MDLNSRVGTTIDKEMNELTQGKQDAHEALLAKTCG